jgi:hypothetical protein
MDGVKDMAFDANKEFQFMWDKLQHYGQNRWLNLILTNWDKAYRKAYSKVYGVKTQNLELPWLLGIFGGIVGSQAMFVQVSFAPLFVGLSKMGGESTLVPLEITQSADEYIADRKLEFGRMLEACSKSILDQIEITKDNSDKITADEFEVFLSRSLLSPIWYPPREPNTDQLAKKFERKMWALAYYDATKTDKQARQSSTAEIWNNYMESRDPSEDGGQSLDPNVLEAFYRDFVQRLRGGQVDEVVIRRNVKYIVQELARPSPIDYPLPAHVKSYLQIITAYKGVTLGLGDREWLLNRLPPVHLGWHNVPA